MTRLRAELLREADGELRTEAVKNQKIGRRLLDKSRTALAVIVLVGFLIGRLLG